MSDLRERIRVGDRVVVAIRGKKRIYNAEFNHNGKHCRLTLKTANRRVAIQRATQIAADLAQGTFRTAERPVEVEKAIHNYLQVLQTKGRSRKTLVKYAGVLRNFLGFLTKRRIRTLQAIEPPMFDAWKAERKAVAHPKTVYTESVIVKQLTSWALSRDLLHKDPFAGIEMEKHDSEPRPAPTLEEVNRILAQPDEPLRTWLHVLAFTGMRVGELQRLRVEDVDFTGNWLHIRSRPGAETKTRLSRKVPMHPRLRNVLLNYPRPQEGWFFQADRSAKHPSGGNWINPKRVNDRFIRLLSKLTLPTGREHGYTCHSLRHFFETITVNANIPQRIIDLWLGHRSDRSMAAVYYTLHDDESHRFMQRVPFGAAPIASIAVL